MYTLNQLKREPVLLNQSNRQMFSNENPKLFSPCGKSDEQAEEEVEKAKMTKFKNHYSVKTEQLVLKSALLMVLLTYGFRASAQSDPSPTQTVGIGNEPYLVTATPGSTYTWSITPGTSGSAWRINGTGNNITVDWNSTGVYTLSVVEKNATGCIGQPQLLVVTVNELPGVTATPSSEAICSGGTTNIALTSNIGIATFAWSAALTSGTATGFSSGTGALIAQTLTNTTTSAATVSYTITPTANGSSGNPITVVVTVYPLPVPTITPSANPVCFGSEGVIYTTESGMTNYTWVTTGGIVSAGGTSTDNTIAMTWNGSGPYSISVNYRNTHGCTSASPTNLNVTITPLPVTSPIYHN